MNGRDEILQYLRNYDGRPLKLMEVCGTHTAAIFKNGIRDLISPKIELISGPGCPVCVTPTDYIDKVLSYARREGHVVLTFGDMMKVPGREESLSQAKGSGARVELMYSPFEAIEKAKKHPETTYVIAAVGFETTAPAYALMIDEAKRQNVANIKLVTALKTIIPALSWICENQTEIDGFICPGHVSTIIGSKPYEELARRYERPFVVAGFEAEDLLVVIYDILRQVEHGNHRTDNLYRRAVHDEGNPRARAILERCFAADEAVWRGLGAIPSSGLYLTGAYETYDGGSRGLDQDKELPVACSCADVIVGRIHPNQCAMFGHGCDPMHPYGPCMVSAEGACGIWYRNR